MSLPTINIFNKQMPKLGIGTWGIGGYMTKSPYSDYINEISQIKFQISKGLSLIDCWIAQGEGGSLELIRQAIEEFDRQKLTLLCKFDIHKYKNATELEVIFQQYLKQLNTDYLDVFEIHRPVFSAVSEKEVESFLKENINTGKIRAFAVSNATSNDLINIEKKMSVPIGAVEILYNIFDRESESNGTIAYCQKKKIPIIAYRPLNRGMTNIAHTNESFGKIVAKYTATPNQVALNWLLAKDGVMALIKSSNRAHINENFDCMAFALSEEDKQTIDHMVLR